MFMKGSNFELQVLNGSDFEASTFTHAVNAGLTTRHLLTGSIPMRQIDIQDVWKKEREAGSVEFGIWTYSPYDSMNSNFFLTTLIGTVGLYSHRPIYRLWEFRILIFDPSAIGHGIGTEATTLVVDYGFSRLNAHRIWLGVHEDNIGAIKCYEKAGFKHEGRLRKELYTYGKYADAVRMGILEEEWRSKLSTLEPAK